MGYIRKYGLYFVLFLILLIGSILSPAFFKVTNIINVLRQVSVNGILAIGMTFVILTGGIDLSVGAILAITGVSMASMLQTSPVWIVVFIGLLIGSTGGMINGLNVSFGRIPPFIATLAIMTSGYGLALMISHGMPVFIDLKHQGFINLGNGHIDLGFFKIPFPIIFLVIVIILANFVLSKTGFGKFIYAIGGNEEAARLSGIKTKLFKTIAYMIGGFLSALAGIIVTARLTVGEPSAGRGYELDAIAAVVIGGTSLSGGIGGIRGTVIGVLIIGLLNNIFNLVNLQPYYQYILKGLIILGALYFEKREK